MALPFTPDPLTYDPDDNYVFRNVRYGAVISNGASVSLLCNVYRSPTRMTGGNPVFFTMHGGSHINNSATEWAEATGGSLPPHGYCLNGYLGQLTSYFASPRYFFDVVSIEPAYHSFGVSQSGGSSWIPGTYFQQETGTQYRGVQSNRGRLLDPIWSVQKCMQFFSAFADDPMSGPVGNMRRSQFFLHGHSVGGATAIGAAFSRSLPYSPINQSRFAAHHKARALGVLVYSPEVNWDPWFMANRHIRANLEFFSSDANEIRADVERALLKPNASGLRPQGSPKTDLAMAMSPVDVIANAPADRRTTRLRAHYYKGFGGGSFEETLSNVYSYSAIPPYDSAGHDWRQFAVLQAACAAADAARADGVSIFSGSVLDVANWPDSGPDLGYLNAARQSVADAYLWACDLIDSTL